MMTRRFRTILLPLALAACSDGRPPARGDAQASALDNEVAETIALQDRTELAVLTNRVVALEREVGMLKANPQAIDLDLLTQRVQALEVRGAAGAESTPPPPPAPDTSGAADAVQRRLDQMKTDRDVRK